MRVKYLNDGVIDIALSFKQKGHKLILEFADAEGMDNALEFIPPAEWAIKIKGHKLHLYPIFKGIVHAKGRFFEVEDVGEHWRIDNNKYVRCPWNLDIAML